jgi:hypothetical protein
MGGEWWRSAAAEAEKMGLLQSRFDRCSARTQGGAVAVQVRTWTSSISTLVEDTAFEQSRLSAAGTTDVQGGSLSVIFTDDVQDVTNTIRRTNTTNNMLVSGSGNIEGGGVLWGYAGAATNVHTLVTASILRNMSLTSEGGWSTGGGFTVQTKAEVTGIRTTIEDSTISGNTLQSTGLVAIRGGSVYLEHNGPASSVAIMVARRSFMLGNSLTVGGNGQSGGARLCMFMYAE